MVNFHALRILAILLITNSHLGSLYAPFHLAFGGHLGNSLFYLLSGFFLARSRDAWGSSEGWWLTRRLVKLVLPITLILGVYNIGNPQGFRQGLLYHVSWTSLGHLEHFLPVLLALYVLFPLLNRLSRPTLPWLAATITLLATASLAVQAHGLHPPPENLHFKGPFYALSGLVCFTLGIWLTRLSPAWLKPGQGQPTAWARSLVLALFVACQAMYLNAMTRRPELIPLNFPLTILSSVALFVLFARWRPTLSKTLDLAISTIAMSSLAVYLAHFEVTYRIQGKVELPWSVLYVFAHSLLIASPLSVITANLAETAYRAIERFGRAWLPRAGRRPERP